MSVGYPFWGLCGIVSARGRDRNGRHATRAASRNGRVRCALQVAWRFTDLLETDQFIALEK